MKIVMFTPVSQASAIGRVALLVTRALDDQGHEVRVVCTELEQPLAVHRFGDDVLSWTEDQAVVSACLGADVCVYQIGDHYPFHAGALRWLASLPGLVCLHDMFVGHLFDGWARANGIDPVSVVRTWYGDDTAIRLRGHLSELDLAERARLAPMTEWISAQAIGVLTHSEWVLDRVLAACPGPIRWAALPYELRRVPIEPLLSHPGRFRLLTIGHMNSNKRVSSVIDAIGTDELLREQVVYTLVGAISSSSRAALVHEAEARGVDLEILGQATDAELAGSLAHTHAIAALRWPCLEAASASAVEAMLSAKPTLVTRAGFYDELPDDCVIKIDIENEVDQIRGALRRLVEDSSFRTQIGERARSYALKQHRAEPYAAALVALAREALAAAAPLDVVREVTRTLERWGVEGDVGDEFIFDPLRPLWSSSAEGSSRGAGVGAR